MLEQLKNYIKQINSMLSYIGDNIKSLKDKFITTDITDEITSGVATIAEKKYKVIRTGDTISIDGYVRTGGALATDTPLHFLTIPAKYQPDTYIAFSVYSPVSCAMCIQGNRIYLINDGNRQLTTGSTIVFSGTWTIGGGEA